MKLYLFLILLFLLPIHPNFSLAGGQIPFLFFPIPTTATCALGKVVFNHTGTVQNFVVPAGCSTLTFKVWGAGGGAGGGMSSVGGNLGGEGGGGGFVRTTLNVTPGDTLNIIVGGFGSGGFNSLGTGGGGGGGGGMSAVRNGTTFLAVAGGGGGGGGASVSNDGRAGGPGGADNGGNGFGGSQSGNGGTGGLGGGGGSGGAGVSFPGQGGGGSGTHFGGNGGDISNLSANGGWCGPFTASAGIASEGGRSGSTNGGGGGGCGMSGGGGGGDNAGFGGGGGGGGSGLSVDTQGTSIIKGISNGQNPAYANDPDYVYPLGSGGEPTTLGGIKGRDGLVVISTTPTPAADTTAPSVIILTGPGGSGSTANFTFSVTDAGGSGLAANSPQCSLDGNPYFPCTGATSHTITALAIGSHTLSVKAIDNSGNRGFASTTWNVTTSTTLSLIGGTIFNANINSTTQIGSGSATVLPIGTTVVISVVFSSVGGSINISDNGVSPNLNTWTALPTGSGLGIQAGNFTSQLTTAVPVSAIRANCVGCSSGQASFSLIPVQNATGLDTRASWVYTAPSSNFADYVNPGNIATSNSELFVMTSFYRISFSAAQITTTREMLVDLYPAGTFSASTNVSSSMTQVVGYSSFNSHQGEMPGVRINYFSTVGGAPVNVTGNRMINIFTFK